MVDFNQSLECLDQLVEIDVVHNLQVSLQQHFEARSQKVNCKVVTQKLVQCQCSLDPDWQLIVSKVLIDSVKNMLEVFLSCR